ncbi:GNAT family N-acetyltransferase [Allorhizobium sp. BGMRC 0089]|uniref:GNAT family N-acetyltransferase n=1 Tax=Allorhizobium sonneratiae TaxID=2934936 RepID=UPI0020345B14|nr:GNAT family N-acetyltransferase [Allorhizobium sonneratiae]MCM2293113.1 GNAT family N-acetyltransferase [Allorhizobium sonneratiae]
MFDIVDVRQDKAALCRDILGELTDWFTLPEVIEACAQEADDLPMFGCRDETGLVGFVSLKPHPPHAMEVFLIAARQNTRGKGVGRLLLKQAEQFAAALGYRLLTVKTLAERGQDEPHFAETRAFYDRNGFLRAEIFTTLWDEDYPCQYFVKLL